MRGTEQKNGREFVLGRPARGCAAREGNENVVRGILSFSYAARGKGGVYKRGRIIGDSLFLLTPRARLRPLSIRSTDLPIVFNWLSKVTFFLCLAFIGLFISRILCIHLIGQYIKVETVRVSRFSNSADDKSQFSIFSIVFCRFFLQIY